VRGESRLESGVYLAKRRFCEVWLLMELFSVLGNIGGCWSGIFGGSRGLFPLDNLVIGVF
jgi:hypothetical protein